MTLEPQHLATAESVVTISGVTASGLLSQHLLQGSLGLHGLKVGLNIWTPLCTSCAYFLANHKDDITCVAGCALQNLAFQPTSWSPGTQYCSRLQWDHIKISGICKVLNTKSNIKHLQRLRVQCTTAMAALNQAKGNRGTRTSMDSEANKRLKPDETLTLLLAC